MADFLLEVRTEEIPARMLARASRTLSTRFFESLTTRGTPPSEVESHYTLRRLVVGLNGLPEREPDREEEALGPPTSVAFDQAGEPTQALIGFAKRCGVAPDQVQRRQTPKGEYAAVVQKIAGESMAEILAALAPRLIQELDWPRSMRWGADTGPWIRPVRGILAILDGEVVPFEVFDVASGNHSAGHPILSPESFAVADWQGYRTALEERDIVLSWDERRRRLEEEFAGAAKALGGAVVEDDDLLDRLAAMCEIPGIVDGRCDPEGIPNEVLTASLRDHQSAFGVRDNGRALPAFLTVMDRPDDPEDLVRQGNEWVVAARLDDARFFVEEDRKRTLIDRRGDLARLTFHQELGSYLERSDLVAGFGRFLCDRLARKNLQDGLTQAAELAKVDLTCEVVKEFTSLQGKVGGIYAREQGLNEEVAAAIYHQYEPASVDDPIPPTLLGRLLGIADRMVSLSGFFALGKAPTGSKDPFALRRAAQGVVEILIGGDLDISTGALAEAGVALFEAQLSESKEVVVEQLTAFLQERVKNLLGRRGFAYDEVAAGVGVDDMPVAAAARVAALHRARESEDFVAVADSAKRIRKILVGQEVGDSVEEDRFETEAERDLWNKVQSQSDKLTAYVGEHAYDGALEVVAEFAPALERFFVDVLVMADDAGLRANRLALLGKIDQLFVGVADFSELAVER